MSYIRAACSHRPAGIPSSVPAPAGFPHARPRPPQGKPKGLCRTVPCSTPGREPPRHRRHTVAALRRPEPVASRTTPDDLQSDAQVGIVRLADMSPKLQESRLEVPLARAPRAPRTVLTWPVITASRCHVRMPDITGQSHLRPVPRLALDTCQRNGHASDQAQ